MTTEIAHRHGRGDVPGDLATLRVHSEGEFSFLGLRWLQRQCDERKIIVWKAGGKTLLSAADIRALITPRPAAQ